MIYIQTRETQENVLLTPLTFIGTDDFSFLFGHWIHAMGVQKYVPQTWRNITMYVIDRIRARIGTSEH